MRVLPDYSKEEWKTATQRTVAKTRLTMPSNLHEQQQLFRNYHNYALSETHRLSAHEICELYRGMFRHLPNVREIQSEDEFDANQRIRKITRDTMTLLCDVDISPSELKNTGFWWLKYVDFPTDTYVKALVAAGHSLGLQFDTINVCCRNILRPEEGLVSYIDPALSLHSRMLEALLSINHISLLLYRDGVSRSNQREIAPPDRELAALIDATGNAVTLRLAFNYRIDGRKYAYYGVSLSDLTLIRKFWPRLSSLKLSQIVTNPEEFTFFLDRHADTLRQLELEDVLLQQIPVNERTGNPQQMAYIIDSWEIIFDYMQAYLSLDRVKFSGRTLFREQVGRLVGGSTSIFGHCPPHEDCFRARLEKYISHKGPWPGPLPGSTTQYKEIHCKSTRVGDLCWFYGDSESEVGLFDHRIFRGWFGVMRDTQMPER